MDIAVSNPIVGVYAYVEDNVMDLPKEPTSYKELNPKQYDHWVNAYKPVYQSALCELQTHIRHISYETFQNSLKSIVTDFKKATSSENFRCVSLVQPGKSQKWVTEVAMTKGFRADAYVCLGEQGADNLGYALSNFTAADKELFKNVVIIDDGSFSGNQMVNNISAANRILTTKFGEKSTFHILIPFITRTAHEKISQLGKKGDKVNVKLYCAEEMPVVNTLVNPKKVALLLEALWPHLSPEERIERGYTTSCYWFDHKMPNSMSFPDTVAKGLVTQPKDVKQTLPIAFLPDVQPPYK